MVNPSITTILTLYNRPEYLEEQLLSIEKQTIKSDKIVLIVNNPKSLPKIEKCFWNRNIDTVIFQNNTKFHGRFSIGLLQKTNYVCIFDDDTIPGSRWYENCLNTLDKTGEAILGTTGVLLKKESYIPNQKVGCNGIRDNKMIEVDLVGHSWFLPTDLLKYLWYERPISFENGEDISLSYLAQKHGGIKTFVPPHPNENINLHGSIKLNYGGDKNAHSLSHGTEHFNIRNKLVKEYIENGWKPLFKKEGL